MADSNFTPLKAFCGCVAVLAWLGLFAAGLLMDSKPYRLELLPHQPNAAVAGLLPDQAMTDPPSFDRAAFLACVALYTPLNAALLTLLAGFVGGCTSSITHARNSDADHAPDNPYLTENPFASMLRAFLVYVGVIAGIYITGGSPFADPSADQYVRFAGTVSSLAFIVGYDPTTFTALVKKLPQPK